MKKYLFAIFPIILFCGFVISPTFAQEDDSDVVEESESKMASIEQKEQIEINDDGLYTKNRLKTQMLELGQEAQIVFVINENMIGENTKAVVRHQVITTQEAPFDTKDSTEFRFDSLASNEVIFPFAPQEVVLFFLRQDIKYQYDSDSNVAGTFFNTISCN